MTQLYLNSDAAYKKLTAYRNSFISTEDPGVTPGTMETLKYVVFNRVCDMQPHQTIKKGTPAKEKPGAGWRNISGENIWFESAWHANYARFLDGVAPKLVSRWFYKPNKFSLGCSEVYEPTFFVEYKSAGSYWVEIDAHKQSVDLKTIMFECYFPEARLFVVKKKEFLKREQFFKNAIEGWE